MSEKIAISVQNVKKDFYLPRHKSDSIKQSIVSVFQKKDKSVDVLHALRGVSFDVKQGEFFGVLGRNGSGKSTLLKIISEIYQPTEGKVKRRGSLVSFIELGVGFKPQLTGRENIYLNGAMLGFSKKEIDGLYDEIVAFAELEDFMEQKIKNYSSGMKVRLAFAVAIQAKSDILVLDEVLAVGDAAFKRKCYDYFRSLKEDSTKTIIFVTHSMKAVRDYCDKAILIEDGKIAAEGDADEVADEYLQLFDEKTETEEGNEEAGRRGTQEITVEDVKVSINKESVKLSATLSATAGLSDSEEVVFGFKVKDSSGKVVAGVNNLNCDSSLKLKFKPNQEKKLTFNMPNILGNDEYRITATIRSLDGRKLYDTRKNITTLRNDKQEAYYPIVYPAQLTVSNRGE